MAKLKFTPKQTISYKHTLRPAFETFEIDAKDAGEMQKYGEILQDITEKVEQPEISQDAEQPKKKAGRPKKTN